MSAIIILPFADSHVARRESLRLSVSGTAVNKRLTVEQFVQAACKSVGRRYSEASRGIEVRGHSS
jgi:hypothetical protein